MKKKPASQSAFFNPRFLISFAFCVIGAVIALVAFAAYPGGNAFARQEKAAAPASVATEPAARLPQAMAMAEDDQDVAGPIAAPMAKDPAQPNVITATFVVNTTVDTADAAAGDGNCADAGGACSLRAAISEANALAGADIITLPAGTYTATLVAANEDVNAGGDFDITSAVTINGAGSGTTIIEANAAPNTATEKVIHIVTASAPAVAINDVTIRHGNSTVNTVGGGVRLTAAGAVVTFTNVIITLNRVNVAGNCFAGGLGITAGTITLTGCTVSNNSAISTVTTGNGFAGGIYNQQGTLNLVNSTVTGNIASSFHGGIRNLSQTTASTVNITNSTISNNAAQGQNTTAGGGPGEGGGLANFAVANTANATVTITGSTFNANAAQVSGAPGANTAAGGVENISVGGTTGPAVINLTNSTVSGNTAAFGGGIYNDGPVGTVNLNYCTVASNTATTQGGGIMQDTTPGGVTNLKSSIVADNTAPAGPNISGTITSQNFNHIEDPIGGTFVAMPNDVVAGDPALGALANNGGPTFTHLPGALVLDTIPPASNECGTTVIVDQRGLLRPFGVGCDKGSVEVQGGASPTPSPTASATPTSTIVPSPTASATATPSTTIAPSPSATCAPVTVSYTGAPVAIPDNNTTGVNLVVAVAGVGTITDLDFRFDGTVSSPDPLSTTVGVNHSWVGDMIFRLTSPGGTTVTFYDRPGVPASTFGCSSNNLFALTIDDEAGSALEGQCPGGTDAGPLTGTFSGNNPLSAFDGQNPNGNWTLTAIDAAGGDTGTVRNFSLIFGGACGTPPPSPTASPTSSASPSASASPSCPPVITHSSSQAITPLNSVSCNNASGHTDNSYWRAFNMNTFVGGSDYNVTSVSFGVEEATGAGGTQPVTVRLYTNSGGAFPAGTRTQIATTTIQVLDSASGTVLNVPLVATVPAGSELVMEVFTPNGQATGNFFFIGSNTAAETGPSYLSAADCGIANPTDTATIGFPDMNIVFNVLGSCPPGGTPTPSPSVSPSATPTCPPNWSAGAVFPAAAVVRAVGAYFPANGMFYSIGGRDGDAAGDDMTNPFEYNPGTNTWVTKPSTYPDNMVNNMACGVLTVSGVDQIYCVGGNAATVVGNASRVFSYNPVTDTFTTLTAADNWPGAGGGAFLPGGFAVHGNKLYIIGSFDATGPPPSVTNQVWQFDPNAAVGSRWLARANFPVARGYVPAATIGNFIYTAGGSNLDGGGLLIDTVESFRYDPVGDVWTTIANIPRATGETRAVVMNGEMWVLGGGRVAPNPSNQVDIYNPGTDTWSTGLPFSTGRRNFPADSDGTARIWLAGGYEGATPVNTMQVFGQGVCPTPTPSPTPGTPTPTPTGTPGTPSPTATASASATASPSATVPGGTPSPTASPAQAVNFSTRMFVRTGDGVGIGGFIVQGSAPKRVILRAIGPTLSRNGITDFLADPVLELHGPAGFTTITNNNWRDDQEQEIQDTGIPPTNDLESAIVATLDPGNYTGVVRGNGNTVGVALIEVYDLDLAAASRLANISTRAFVSNGDNIVIAGFILGNNGGNDNVIVRGLGPSLSALGVPTVLANPTLDMRNANGTLVFTNNDWQDNPTQAGIIAAAGLAPSDPLEAAIAATLPPDLYTVLLAGLNKVVGNGLVEVYDLANGDPFPTPTPGISPTPVPSPTVTPGASPSPGVSPSPAASATPSPAASPSPSPPAGNCTENFDGGSSLPAGWVATNDQGPPPLWAISTTNPDTPPNDAFVSDTSVISDKRLDTRPIVIGGGPAQLTFRNFYDFEYDPPPAEVFWDGGVLEVSINGGPFLDVIDPGIGGSFVSGGYNGVIDDSANNPLAAQQAWGANTAGAYINSVVNLGPNVVGQSIVLRFRMGTDEAIGAPGWRIDTLVVTGGSCP